MFRFFSHAFPNMMLEGILGASSKKVPASKPSVSFYREVHNQEALLAIFFFAAAKGDLNKVKDMLRLGVAGRGAEFDSLVIIKAAFVVVCSEQGRGSACARVLGFILDFYPEALFKSYMPMLLERAILKADLSILSCLMQYAGDSLQKDDLKSYLRVAHIRGHYRVEAYLNAYFSARGFEYDSLELNVLPSISEETITASQHTAPRSPVTVYEFPGDSAENSVSPKSFMS